MHSRNQARKHPDPVRPPARQSSPAHLPAKLPLPPTPRSSHQALTNRKIFVFGELLFMDNMQALRDTEHAEYLRLLELFAYGTYSQYLAQRDQYPDMNAAQVSGGRS